MKIGDYGDGSYPIAIQDYQRDYEQKHIASAVRLCRQEQLSLLKRLLKKRSKQYVEGYEEVIEFVPISAIELEIKKLEAQK